MSDGVGQPVHVGRRSDRRVGLTRTQAQIWTSQRLHPDVPLANMADRIRLTGLIDPDRLVRAFDTVVRAVEVLRMVVDEGPEPRARILTSPPQSTEVVDVPATDIDAWSRDRIARPIDATRCVYDSVLLRHADDDWTWWLDLHHVATDAMSSALVFRATADAYERDDGDPSQLADVIDDTFFDAEPPRADRTEAWATDAGPREPLTPYGARGPRTTSVERCAVPVEQAAVDRALADSYRTISRDLSLLTISAMTAAQAMARLDGRRTVVVGVPIHHRSSPDARKRVGPLMELYPLAVTLEAGQTNRDQFRTVYRSIVDLLRRAKPGESPDDGFEIVLNVFTAEHGAFAGVPSQVEWMRSNHVDPNHVVRFQVYGRADTTDVRWELDVNTELSADGSWRRLPDHVGAVVRSIVGQPDAVWSDTSLVGLGELDELRLLDAATMPPPVTTPVHEQIRTLLAADPDRVVVRGEATLSAAEFDRRADELAGWLVARGAGHRTKVGLRMPRSTDVLVAVQGVLRAGAAFVMLDPDDPVARHDAIAADADLAMILDGLPPDDELPSVDDRPSDVATVELDDLAYVLYTSGSTGEPKGVPISHRGLADYLRFAVDAYVDHDEPVVALHSRLVFDLTITSLFLSLLAGGRTVVFPGSPVDALGQVARDDTITILKATPSQLELFTRLATDPRPLRTVIVGGEAFRRPVAERLRSTCEPGVRIFNEYGPTEAVVGCMIHEYDPAVDVGADVPIGRAADGCRLRVLDTYGHVTPTGSWGELYVHRPGMADSYLHRPELSAELFVDLDRDGRVWYRTGDRVRVERPGVATFGGRMDDQVKVGGVRLEPAEVEAAMVRHPEVVSALVRVWQPTMHGPDEIVRCVRCGLGADVPGVEFGAEGVCSVCHSYDQVEPQTRAWFRTPADLDRQLADVRRRHDGEIDCLHLLSGGKDSTYALYQLVERGWRVHALTLDNGFISDGAKENIRRSIADLGITHEFATTDAMNEIFRDSLDRYSNVCQGCYKTIYTLAVARAVELGIPVIVTGLSRGQFFETRLVPHQFEHGRFDPDEIDRTVLEARRVYHRTADAVTQLLPEQRVFDSDDVFERVEFLDFYRYVDVDLAEVYRFLDARAPWVRPADTGRSTNCLINVAGIQVHRHEQGFHNYAEPYSWDVRLGHKTRAEALDELDDDVDDDEVDRLLAEVGYRPKTNEVLAAWYQTRGGRDLDPDDLRSHLRALLPDHAVPNAFVRIDEVPLAASAKADVSALPAPTRFHRHGGEHVAPTTTVEARLCEIWCDVLGLESVGITDDFFDLGGASLAALEVVAAADAEFGTDLHDATVFRARTVRDLAAVVAAEQLAETADEPLPVLDDAPLSAGEEAMLFEYRADPTSTRYNVTRRYTIDGDIDVDRLEQAIRDVVSVHGPLHTSYAAERHRLSPDETVSFERLPITDDEAFDRFADVQRTVPFDLDAGPLVRVHWAPTGERRTSLLIGVHHITIDAGTFDVFWTQIAERYAGGDLPELAHSYAEHGAWQRSRQSADATEFWLARSADRRPTQPFGLAAPRPPVDDGYVTRRLEVTPSELTAAGGTAFAASMAATATTLGAFIADDRVEFGITASTKDHLAATELVGYYLNTLPVGFDLDGSRSFADIVRVASARVSDALPHRSYPFAEIVRDARAAGHEVPNVGFMLAYEALSTPTLADADVSHRILASGTAVADLSLIVQERVDSVQVGLEYRGTVVDRIGAERVLDVFETVLVGGLRRPTTTIADLVAPHRGRDLDGDALTDTDGTVLTRIAACAAADPDAVAVIAGAAELSWGDLARQVVTVAKRLRMAGRPDRVGVAIERSADLVIALLASQFAGAAYVPLDPTVGAARLERMAQAAGIDRLIVRPGGDRHGLDEDRVIELDPLRQGPPLDPDDLTVLAAEIGADRPAYVIFTSGSTGRPRGVEVTHANLLASTAARSVWYPEDPARFLVTPSVGFDSSVVGLFWTLATGGTVVLPTDDEVHDVDRLGELIAERGVTHTLMVPSLHRALVSRAGHRLDALDVAIVAGEACTPDVVSEHVAALPSTSLVNEYGPTEATVWATAHVLGHDHDRVPIGTPIPSVTARIADASLLPVPDGVRGELLIAGPTVTGGYLGDPAATADRFVEIGGRRWYRTGDLVRSDDRVLDYVGRLDDQLNVGGVRLEPAEVERELLAWPAIDAAIVVAAGSPPKLVAHLEAHDEVDEGPLRTSLAAALPTGSVPRHLVTWPSLPRTPNGKLDRAAAAALPFDDRMPRRTSADTLLDVVIDAWATALGRGDIAPDDDFFEVGGDSLAAVEIVTRLGDELDRTVAIGTLLAAPTPRRLAVWLGADVRPDATDEEFQLVTLRSGADDGPLVVVTPAWDAVFSYQALAESFDAATTVLALSYHEQPHRPVVTSIDDLVTASLPAVRAARAGRSEVAIVGWSVGGLVAVEVAERFQDLGEPVDLVAAIDTFFPGEQRHLWSNRWWKYRSMLRPGGYTAAVTEVRTMAARRVRRVAGRLGRRMMAWSGETLPPEVPRTAAGRYPAGALDHPIDVVRTPMVFFAATTTNPERTSRHWERVADQLTIVTVDGRHRGFDSIMAEDRVGRISAELSARLGDPR